MRRLTDVSQTNLTSTNMMSAILEVTMKKEGAVCTTTTQFSVPTQKVVYNKKYRFFGVNF